jgi:predicted RNase H-like nuclease (RuvC/YqgF family)
MIDSTIEKQNSLQIIVQTWQDQIICFSPQGEGYSAYFVDSRNGSPVNYIQASCDELRHLGTNYNSILNKIKEQYYGYLKEAILNSVKYETTRRAVRKQHQWIQSSYQVLIEHKTLTVEQQSSEIDYLKQIIEEQNQAIAVIKSECRGQLAAIQADVLLKQKEAEIEQKNNQIAQLNQQLQECDREITGLKSELNQGLQELKLKYKGLIAQFVKSCTNKQQIDSQNKSLQACKNIFIKAQNKINLLQSDRQLVEQYDIELQGKIKLLKIKCT